MSLFQNLFQNSKSCTYSQLLRSIKRSLHSSCRNYDETGSTVIERPPLPLIVSRQIDRPNPFKEPKQAWLENLDTLESKKLGIIDLHPDIFGAPPRIDILYKNVRWQQEYKHIDYRFAKSRAEIRGSGKKLFSQKNTGRKRAGDIRASHRKDGGISHGPRGPDSKFFMLPDLVRALGLRVALSFKYAQNDLHIVDSLEVPTEDPQYMEELIDTRYWGFSALFVDDTDFMPKNISLVTSEYPQYNLMPVYGLNVYSMLKHETLVLSLAAVEKIEKKLLEHMYKQQPNVKFKK